jgi:hypothetical protein
MLGSNTSAPVVAGRSEHLEKAGLNLNDLTPQVLDAALMKDIVGSGCI